VRPVYKTWADGRQVVAVEGDVERADRQLLAFHPLDLLGQPFGQRQAAGMDADQPQVGQVGMPLEQLAGHSPQDSFHLARVDDAALLLQADVLGLAHHGLRVAGMVLPAPGLVNGASL
jgi:hypothetical protein